MTDAALWSLEERLWLEGASAYEDALDPACLMAFPQMGVMETSQILRSLRDAPRWASVDFSDQVIRRPADHLAVLAYSAVGRRDDGPAYRCLCTSTWRETSGGWRMIQHQQTPTTEQP